MNGHVFPFAPSVHVEAQRLLPWLVNGTLEFDEREWLQRHLDTCTACQREFQSLQVEQAACRDSRAPPGDVEAGWRRLQHRLASMDRPEGRRGSARARWTPAPRWLAWALMVQTALLLALAAAVWWPRAQPTMYHTLATPVARTGNLVIVFDPQLSELQLRRMLAASQARIVDGPNEAGAYVLAVTPDRVDSVRDALRAAPGVTMVESLKPGAQP